MKCFSHQNLAELHFFSARILFGISRVSFHLLLNVLHTTTLIACHNVILQECVASLEFTV